MEKLLSAKERRLKDGGLSDTFLASPLDDAFVRQVCVVWQCIGEESPGAMGYITPE